jgi:hypothetical protein
VGLAVPNLGRVHRCRIVPRGDAHCAAPTPFTPLELDSVAVASSGVGGAPH